MAPNPPTAPPLGAAAAGIELGPAIAPVEAPQAPAKKLYEAPVLKKLGEIEAEKPLTPETAREHLEAIIQAKNAEPVTSTSQSEPPQAEKREPVAEAAPEEPEPVERKSAEPQSTHPTETPQQMEEINKLLKEINALLYKIKSPDLQLTHLATQVNGALPLGAELRQQALDLVRKDLRERAEGKASDKEKTRWTSLADRIETIYPEAGDRRHGAFVSFLNEHRSQIEPLLPRGVDVKAHIEQVARGQIDNMTVIEELSKDTDMKKALALGLTGSESMPKLDPKSMLVSAGQNDNLITRKNLEHIFNPKEPVPFKKRVMSYGGIGLMLLLMIIPMMNEGGPQQGH